MDADIKYLIHDLRNVLLAIKFQVAAAEQLLERLENAEKAKS